MSVHSLTKKKITCGGRVMQAEPKARTAICWTASGIGMAWSGDVDIAKCSREVEEAIGLTHVWVEA